MMATPLSAARTFGEDLQQIRLSKRESVQKLGKEINASKGLIRAWEADEAVPTGLHVLKLFAWAPILRRWDLRALEKARENRAPIPSSPRSDPGGIGQNYDQDAPAPESDRGLDLHGLSFYAALRVVRIEEGLTQDELGDLLQVTGQAVAAWENGVNNISEEMYLRVLELLPQMAAVPRPSITVINKPSGPMGPTGERVIIAAPIYDIDDTTEPENDMAQHPGISNTSTPIITVPPKPMSSVALFTKRIIQLKSKPENEEMIVLLEQARDHGVTVQDLLELLR